MALFAALSYAVTQSGRSGSGVDKEQAVIKAARLSEHISNVQTAVMRLTLTGTDYDEIDWSIDGNDGLPATDTPLFLPSGGGVIWQDASDIIGGSVDWSYIPSANSTSFSVDGVGTAANDDLMTLKNVPLEICKAFNKGMGLPTNPIASDDVNFFTIDTPLANEEEIACIYKTAISIYEIYIIMEKN